MAACDWLKSLSGDRLPQQPRIRNTWTLKQRSLVANDEFLSECDDGLQNPARELTSRSVTKQQVYVLLLETGVVDARVANRK